MINFYKFYKDYNWLTARPHVIRLNTLYINNDIEYINDISFLPNCCIKMDDIITPTLPNVSARI